MCDHIASFSLRDSSTAKLSTALGRTYAEYNAWHGPAVFIANFADDAHAAGVNSVLADRIHKLLDYAEAEGILFRGDHTRSNAELADELAEQHSVTADIGVKIAAIVLLHNACERFFWRLARFGLIANRTKAVEWIANRKVSVADLAERDNGSLIDGQLEKWWCALDRESLMTKWDRLIGLFGFPERLQDGAWSFDRGMLERFDDVRHNAVHHDAQALNHFDFIEFATQLSRAQMAWLVRVGLVMEVQIPPHILFSPVTE